MKLYRIEQKIIFSLKSDSLIRPLTTWFPTILRGKSLKGNDWVTGIWKAQESKILYETVKFIFIAYTWSRDSKVWAEGSNFIYWLIDIIGISLK